MPRSEPPLGTPPSDDKARQVIAAYDDEAEATGWLGPELAFGLAYPHIRPGQSILDIGIGTGLGSVLFRTAGLKVHGMDISTEMLAACRVKGFTNLTRHDLTEVPYPYDSASMDHAVCLGVLQFFSDLAPVFGECERILRPGGAFIFVIADRAKGEAPELVVGPEHTKLDYSVTMYRHSAEQISRWIGGVGFSLRRSLPFTVYMDRERSGSMPATAWLVVRT